MQAWLLIIAVSSTCGFAQVIGHDRHDLDGRQQLGLDTRDKDGSLLSLHAVPDTVSKKSVRPRTEKEPALFAEARKHRSADYDALIWHMLFYGEEEDYDRGLYDESTAPGYRRTAVATNDNIHEFLNKLALSSSHPAVNGNGKTGDSNNHNLSWNGNNNNNDNNLSRHKNIVNGDSNNNNVYSNNNNNDARGNNNNDNNNVVNGNNNNVNKNNNYNANGKNDSDNANESNKNTHDIANNNVSNNIKGGKRNENNNNNNGVENGGYQKMSARIHNKHNSDNAHGNTNNNKNNQNLSGNNNSNMMGSYLNNNNNNVMGLGNNNNNNNYDKDHVKGQNDNNNNNGSGHKSNMSTKNNSINNSNKGYSSDNSGQSIASNHGKQSETRSNFYNNNNNNNVGWSDFERAGSSAGQSHNFDHLFDNDNDNNGLNGNDNNNNNGNGVNNNVNLDPGLVKQYGNKSQVSQLGLHDGEPVGQTSHSDFGGAAPAQRAKVAPPEGETHTSAKAETAAVDGFAAKHLGDRVQYAMAVRQMSADERSQATSAASFSGNTAFISSISLAVVAIVRCYDREMIL